MRFTSKARDGSRGSLLIPVSIDPDVIWSAKPRHHVSGTVNGRRFRGTIERHDDGWAFHLTPPLQRDLAVAVGDDVAVDFEPEGPQRADLAPDIAAALGADPDAGAFFDGLAQFYRKGYLRWIDGTKRDPAERARRIAKSVELLRAGRKDYRDR